MSTSLRTEGRPGTVHQSQGVRALFESDTGKSRYVANFKALVGHRSKEKRISQEALLTELARKAECSSETLTALLTKSVVPDLHVAMRLSMQLGIKDFRSILEDGISRHCS